MAGLYDDLPEPQAESQTALSFGNNCSETQKDDFESLGPRPDAGSSHVFKLDDVILQHMFSYLALPDVGNVLPAVCPLLLYLRSSWSDWRRFAQPLILSRPRIQLTQLLNIHSRSLEELSHVSESLGKFAVEAFQGFRRLPSFAPDLHALSYCELPIPRVVWSLHNEGLSRWRNACAAVVDGTFALLPPWDRVPRKAFLPKKVRILVGVSLWLPPNEVAAEHSFPSLYLNAILLEPEKFEALAERHPSNPPCLAATCEALLLRMMPGTASTLEDWSWRFCFGPEGFRHAGHGDLEGYRHEIQTPGQRRWRPPELCFAAKEENAQSLRLLLRSRRCIGLLDWSKRTGAEATPMAGFPWVFLCFSGIRPAPSVID